MQCPGQDTRYWKPDDVFEVPCQACGQAVEFFKTDGTRRCPSCGERLKNPRISMGCAKWCAYAKECLGYDPKEVELEESAEGSLTDQIIQLMKEELGEDQKPLTHALLVLNRAQDLLAEEEGNAQVVLAAALLHEVGVGGLQPTSTAEDGTSGSGYDTAIARRILEAAAFKEDVIAQVCQVILRHHGVDGEDTAESRLIGDADRLAEVPEKLLEEDGEALETAVEEMYRTPTGRRLALQMAARRQAG